MSARVLIIEDDASSHELVRYLLEASGYATLSAFDGAAGVRLALDQQPDLLLCDLQMPIMNGYQVIESLHEYPLWRKVPVLAVTAFSMPGDRERVLAAGFDEHISKPISPQGFVAQIERHLPATLRSPRRPRNEPYPNPSGR